MVTRRTAMTVTGAALAALVAACARKAPPDARWLSYKSRFLLPEGRVADTGNGGVSHSEGQGYGMLFAAAHDDRAAFDALWAWTQKTLARVDGLHAWRYQPGPAPEVADPNNASDGDLLMAWALVRAGRKWGDTYTRAGVALAESLKAAVVRADGRAYLLPGLAGFTGENTRVVNLSYWIFPALNELGRATGDDTWHRVAETGVILIDQARFGAQMLPPDWLETEGTLAPAGKFPPRFGYDAVRVPLNLIWGGFATPQRLAAINGAWTAGPGPAPAWIDVITGETSPEKQSAGMQAVARLTASFVQGQLPAADTLPALDTAADYYSASLLMQAALCLSDLSHAQ